MAEDLKALIGEFIGELVVSMDDGGTLMTLIQPFGYTAWNGDFWPVPRGAKTDGASIPRLLWTAVGSPFTGKYRKAAVVHDYYCDVRIQPWVKVHRMFFEAMITAGVSAYEAKLLYAGVYFGGPRWNEQAVDNARLGRPDGGFTGNAPGDAPGGFSTEGFEPDADSPAPGGFDLDWEPETETVLQPSPKLTEDQLDAMAKSIKAADLGLDEIEKIADTARRQALRP